MFMHRIAFKYIFLILIVLTVTCYAKAQDSIARPECPQVLKPVFKTNILPILWGTIPFTSEYRFVTEIPVGQFQSTQIGISYLGKGPLFKWYENTQNQVGPQQVKLIVSGFRFQISHKFYFSDEYAPYGIYISPHFSYSTARMTTKYFNNYNIYYGVSHLNANALVGYQVEYNEMFLIDIFTGLGYKQNVFQEVQHSLSTAKRIDTSEFGWLYNGPLKFTLGFNIGVIF